MAAGVALLGIAPAGAAPFAVLSATYSDPLSNTVFTITNDTATAETIRLMTSLAPNTTVTLPTLAANGTETYSFSQISGGFETDPFNAGTPDTTTYTFSVTQGAVTATSAAFSPISNATGGYVDFLGNTCQGIAFGCTGVVLSGVVASVPEPFALSILMTGLFGLASVRRRG